jgi:hypothetical protein
MKKHTIENKVMIPLTKRIQDDWLESVGIDLSKNKMPEKYVVGFLKVIAAKGKGKKYICENI